MSQRDVEALLGRLLTDAQLRQCFFEAPEGFAAPGWYEVSPRELRALLRIDEKDLEGLAAKIGALVRPASGAADRTHGNGAGAASHAAAKPALPTRQASAS